MLFVHTTTNIDHCCYKTSGQNFFNANEESWHKIVQSFFKELFFCKILSLRLIISKNTNDLRLKITLAINAIKVETFTVNVSTASYVRKLI